MNTQTNELYDLTKIPKEEILGKMKLDRILEDVLVPIPENLDYAARVKLNGKAKAQVSFNSRGKLSRFAANQRRGRR